MVVEEDVNFYFDEGENSGVDIDINVNFGGFGEIGRCIFVFGGFVSFFCFVCRRWFVGGFGRSVGDFGCGFGGWVGFNLGGIVSIEFLFWKLMNL